MSKRTALLSGTLSCVLVVGIFAPAASLAGPFGSDGGAVPVTPSCTVTIPNLIPGKEYSHNQDYDASPALDAEQNIAWDGLGGVADTFDYSGSRPNDSDGQVDALANAADALFWPVYHDEVPLLFSIEQNECSPLHAPSSRESLYYETPGWCPPVPARNVWAQPCQVDQHAGCQINPYDLDGVEVWGPTAPDEPMNDEITGGLGGPGNDDANRYSLVGDPVDPNTGLRVSVWAYNPQTNTSAPWVGEAALQQAVEGLFGEELTEGQADEFDLDAMMTWDFINPGTLDPGVDAILFSLRPISPVIDGGEIIFWDFAAPAQYLNHGGHLWDRLYDVAIDPHDLESPGNWNFDANVDAIEAIPEPATLGLLCIGGLVLLARRRRRLG